MHTVTQWFSSLPPLESASLAGASLCLGLACGGFSYALLSVISARRSTSTAGWSFEGQRRQTLREHDAAYRWFEPLIDDLAARAAAWNPARLDKIRHDLTAADERLPWQPEEVIAVKLLESVMASLVCAGLGGYLAGVPGAIGLGVIGAWGWQELRIKQIGDRARARMHALKKRLPYAVDLMALMMEAGATFLESVRTVVRENQRHPLGEELGKVLRELELGRTRREALEAFEARIADDDVSELTFAIIKGEEFGTPLSHIFRSQADQMRLKRSQWAEKAAADAQVKIVFPGMIVMTACLLIILAPFLLSVPLGW